MNSVERVKALCKENQTPISKLERDLGFGNGYISQLRKGVFPTDRAVAIAKYFNVSTEYITGEADQKEKPDLNEEIGPNKAKLLDALEDMSEAEQLMLLEHIQRIKSLRGD